MDRKPIETRRLVDDEDCEIRYADKTGMQQRRVYARDGSNQTLIECETRLAKLRSTLKDASTAIERSQVKKQINSLSEYIFINFY